MIILGIDPSLTSTGLVALNDLGEILEHKMIKTKKLRGIPRLKFIKDEVLAFIKKHNVEKAAIESYAYGIVRSNTKFNLGELGGVIRLLLHEGKIDYLDIAPPTLKKYITGTGNADKPMVIYCVNKRWGVDFGKESDLADAYGLAHIALDKYVKDIDLRTTIKQITKEKVKYYENIDEAFKDPKAI